MSRRNIITLSYGQLEGITRTPSVVVQRNGELLRIFDVSLYSSFHDAKLAADAYIDGITRARLDIEETLSFTVESFL